MSDSALEEYMAGIDPRAVPIVHELDRLIMSTHPGFGLAIKYKILMYGLRGDFRTWVCAINASSKRVALSFLYGALLDDPRHVLRAGSSILKDVGLRLR